MSKINKKMIIKFVLSKVTKATPQRELDNFAINDQEFT